MLEYGSILYSGAASSHVNRLESFQSQIESMFGSTFSSLIDRRHASILGFTCHLLDGEGRGNFQTFCPTSRQHQIDYHTDCTLLTQLSIFVL